MNQKYILEALYRLKQENQFTDRSIFVGEKEFKVHDVIIAMHSNFYRRAIENQKQTSNVRLPKNITENVMFDLLCLIYERGVFVINVDEFKAALKYLATIWNCRKISINLSR